MYKQFKNKIYYNYYYYCCYLLIFIDNLFLNEDCKNNQKKERKINSFVLKVLMKQNKNIDGARILFTIH